ncbi:MAG: aminotransferase class I/II-fold pyridoxal phosphate-dependent enzyme [Treponema sp.]|jgi:cystathionine beta-lyase|nr:aminotransferase class I/II-fold pyridoxal phosphate-dependent enzyme [Treponema sp.]
MNSSYDFDAPVNWRSTGSDKWDSVAEGVIPLWVADMDFVSPPELTGVLSARASLPFYGYNKRRPAYLEAIAAWYRNQYGVSVDTEDILPGPGTVPSLGMAVRAFTKSGDGVLVMTPVYTPFFRVIRESGRKVVEAPMELDGGGRFVFDRAALERAASAAGGTIPLALFCSPHNPGGRVWAKEEIQSLLDFAQKRNMIVAADEIHGDFVYGGSFASGGSSVSGGGGPGFVSTASFPGYAGNVITVSGANKSFNLGGLHASHMVVRDKTLKAKLRSVLSTGAHHDPDIFAELAVETCYTKCAEWFAGLRLYIRKNLEAAAVFLNAIPGIKTWVPGGTYLLWADARGLIEKTGCENDGELVRRLEEEAKVKITGGSMYGKPGEGFVRINAASPRSLLMEGLGRLEAWAKNKP